MSGWFISMLGGYSYYNNYQLTEKSHDSSNVWHHGNIWTKENVVKFMQNNRRQARQCTN